MSRWNATAVLKATSVEVDGNGRPVETATARTVFCNERHMGATDWAASRSAGLHADAQIEVRTCDYRGEGSCSYGGADFEVERAKSVGETTLLTLKRRLRS